MEHNASPYREETTPMRSIGTLEFANPMQSNRENISKLSNSSSRNGLKGNLGSEKPGKSSRVSYDELRDLLWK